MQTSHPLPAPMGYERVQQILEKEAALTDRLGDKTLSKTKKSGEKVYISPGAAEIAEELQTEGKDPFRVDKNEILKRAMRFIQAAHKHNEEPLTPAAPVMSIVAPARQPRNLAANADLLAPRNKATEKAGGDEICAPVRETNKGLEQEQSISPGTIVQSSESVADTSRKMLHPCAIKLDTSIQCRAALNNATVAHYSERMKAGDKFPPVIVFDVGGVLLLADGFHRHPAAELAGMELIEAEIHHGSRSDAVKFAIQANSAHGLPRSNEDKRRAVQMALTEFPDLSDHAIAEMCKVSQTLVSKMRPQLKTIVSCEKRTGRDGKKRKMPRERVSVEPHATAFGMEPTESVREEPDNKTEPTRVRYRRNREHHVLEEGQAANHPKDAERGFDLNLSWRQFRDVVISEHERWPEESRPMFVYKLKLLISTWKSLPPE